MLLYSMLFTLATCVSTDSTEYIELPMNANLDDYIGKHVVFEAQFCDFEMNHMLRFSMDEDDTHFCIDQKDGEETGIQVLAYTTRGQLETLDEYKEKRFKVYGLFESFTSKGRGGTMHTEYYLEFDLIELIEDE